MTNPTPPETKRKPVSVVPIQPQRPDPPSDLSKVEAAIWKAAVSGMRRDWFVNPAVQVLLRAFCTQSVVLAEIEARLRALRGSDDADYRVLVTAHVNGCKALLKLGTALRITPRANRQSVRDGREATSRPWEIKG